MRIPSVALAVVATAVVSTALNTSTTPTPSSGFLIQPSSAGQSHKVEEVQGQAIAAAETPTPEPGVCPAGYKNEGSVAGAPCYARCAYESGDKPDQYHLRPAGSDCGTFMFTFPMKCTESGLCNIV
ncbi:hypothetical protein BDV18DRAFT_140823 [Aspergillus unguis]